MVDRVDRVARWFILIPKITTGCIVEGLGMENRIHLE
jgi:hypothetical protein